MKKIICVVALLICILESGIVNAQNKSEYFVTVNPVTGTYHTVSEIPQIKLIPEGLPGKYSTYDCKHKRFIFKGLDSLHNKYLITIDAANGNVLYNPPHPNTGDTLDDVFYLHYDTTSNKLYGIFKDASLFPPFLFVSIDQITGNITAIANLTGVTALACCDQYSALDQHNGRYIFYGVDATGPKLFTLDIYTGNIIYSPNIGSVYYRDFQYDMVTDKLYGILLSGNPPIMANTLVCIDIITGNYTSIATIPGVVSQVPSGTRFSTFDSNHGRYIFRGGDVNGDWFLYSIDINNGNIVYSPAYPLPPTNTLVDNVVELQYDNSQDTLYALHWGDAKVTSIKENLNNNTLSFYPNPTSSTLTINTATPTQIKIINILGETVLTTKLSKENTIVDVSALNKGIYFIEAIDGDKRMSAKFIKE